MSVGHGTPNQIKFIMGIIALGTILVIFPFSARDLPYINTVDGVVGQATNDKKNRTDFYKVTRVVDGDTIVIAYINNIKNANGEIQGEIENKKVRLIGINSPESVDPRRPVQCFGKEASTYLKSLTEGAIVQLEYDSSQDKLDKYGRILAYVYMEDGQMVNKKMIADGYAYEYTYDKPYKYLESFKAAQVLAEKGGRGLWSADTCNGQK